MTAEEIIQNYGRVHYRATDEQFHLLKGYYPICMRVAEDSPLQEEGEVFYLDTGGPMGTDIDFFVARVVGHELQRRDDDGTVWRRISPELRIEGDKNGS